jgi:hypothetical protein
MAEWFVYSVGAFTLIGSLGVMCAIMCMIR